MFWSRTAYVIAYVPWALFFSRAMWAHTSIIAPEVTPVLLGVRIVGTSGGFGQQHIAVMHTGASSGVGQQHKVVELANST